MQSQIDISITMWMNSEIGIICFSHLAKSDKDVDCNKRKRQSTVLEELNCKLSFTT